jgi:hypothetical protein
MDRRTNGLMDGRTDMTKLIAAFLYFANPSKNKRLFCYNGPDTSFGNHHGGLQQRNLTMAAAD